MSQEMNQKFKGLVSNLPLEIKKIIMIKMLDDILQACHGHISVADQATKDLRILKLAFGDADFTTAFKPALERFERHCCIDPSEYASAQRKLFGDICASNEQPHLPGRVKSNGADFDLALNSAKELNDRRAVGECYKQRRANMEWAATRWSYEYEDYSPFDLFVAAIGIPQLRMNLGFHAAPCKYGRYGKHPSHEFFNADHWKHDDSELEQ